MKIIRTTRPTGEIVTLAMTRPGYGCTVAFNSEGDPFIDGPEEPVGPTLLAPIVPALIIGIAQNYRAHAAEMQGQPPERPVFFIKMPNSVIGPNEPILLPRKLASTKVDYEAELAVVIKRDCKNATMANAMQYVLGYCCSNDVTARDWQKEWGGGQFCRGKGFDSFCPLGSWIVTVDEIADPHQLAITGRLNHTIVQQSSTAELIFSIEQLIVFLSGSTTLPAGTVILTGTPAGVGMASSPQRFLQQGDIFHVEITGLGTLSNPVREEIFA